MKWSGFFIVIGELELFKNYALEVGGERACSVRNSRWIFCLVDLLAEIIIKNYMLRRTCGIISKNTGHSIRLQSDGDETIESERAVACSLSVLLGSAECSALGG